MAGELDGRYRLLELVGVGGMGRVWRAEDTLLQRTVAIKEILTSSGPVREARAAARLDHPGVVKVYDVLTSAGRSWIVMEYVASRSLHAAVSEDGPMPPDEVARIGLRMVAALRKAHTAGVLHRDVKPDNVLLALDGRVVLSDFGLATVAGLDGPDPRLGSPSYIAPERLLSWEAGVPGDLWSLGATLYYAVEGRRPFTRDDGGAALRALIDEPPDPLALAGDDLGPLLLALLDKDPLRRPAAEEVEDRLRAVARTGSFRGRARVRPSRMRLVLAGGAVLVAVTGGAAVAATGGGRPGPGPRSWCSRRCRWPRPSRRSCRTRWTPVVWARPPRRSSRPPATFRPGCHRTGCGSGIRPGSRSPCRPAGNAPPAATTCASPTRPGGGRSP